VDKLLEEQNEGSLEGENTLGVITVVMSMEMVRIGLGAPLFRFNDGGISICCKTNVFRVAPRAFSPASQGSARLYGYATFRSSR